MIYNEVKKALENIISGNNFNVVLIDSNGNIISDVPLSTLARTRVYEQDFENGTTDTTVNNATQTVQGTEVYAGSYALQVTVAAGATGYVETPSRPVSPNQQVTFAFAHKEDANITDVKLIVVWYRASGGVISTEEHTLTPSTSWQIDARTVTAPQNSATMGLRIQATAGSADGNVYIDEITIDLIGQILRVDGAGQVKVADSDVLTELQAKLETADLDIDSLKHVVTERITGQSGLRSSGYTIPTGTMYQIPSYETVILYNEIYADGDLYVEGILEVV